MKQIKIFALLLAFFGAFAQTASAQDATAKNKATIQAAYDALNRHDWAGFVALCDAKYTEIGVAPEPLVGPEVAIEAYKQFFVAFPNLKLTIHDIANVSPTRFLVRLTLSGTNTGPLMGIPATGKSMRYEDCDLVEFNAAGKITLHQPTKGGPEVFRQLGIDPTSPVEANKRTALTIMDLIGKHDLDGGAALYATNATFHGWTPQQLDVNGWKQVMGGLIASVPDAKFVVEDVAAEGDKVFVRHHLEGTHTGAAFQGVPAANKPVYANAIVEFQFKDGKPVELWLNADFLGFMIQIGGIPAPGK